MRRLLPLILLAATACKPDIHSSCLYDCRQTHYCAANSRVKLDTTLNQCVANCELAYHTSRQYERERWHILHADCSGLTSCDWFNCIMCRPNPRDWAFDAEGGRPACID